MGDTDSPAGPAHHRTTALIVAGAALVCGGAVLGLAGLGLTTVALVNTLRDRVNRMPVPPRDLARRTWSQTKAATTAGRSAWQRATVPPAVPGN